MNLITDPWIPVLRKSGYADVVAPWQLTETDDPIIAFNAPRPDFDGALWQFAIGLLQTCVPPEGYDVWLNWLEKPPNPAMLKKKLATKYLHAFEIQSERGSFMQDFEPLEGKRNGIAQLLIDMPGVNTVKLNRDHFVKRGTVKQLCPSCVVMALFTLQTNAYGFGSGHWKSLRHDSHLTTLVILDDTAEPSPHRLWSDIWLNVLDLEAFPDNISGKNAPQDIFPWLAKTRASSGGDVTTPKKEANIMQMYWAMPMRIQIKWDETADGTCDVCGKHTNKLVGKWVTKKHGVKYEAWKHTLSPYFYVEKINTWLPHNLKKGDVSYKNWLGLVTDEKNCKAARVVSYFNSASGRKLREAQLRLYAFGYQMKKADPICWYETKFPLFTVKNKNFTADVLLLIETAEDCAKTLIRCVNDSWFPSVDKKSGKKIKSEKIKDLPILKKEFYQRTQECFYRLAKRYAESEEEGNGAVWHKTLEKEVLSLFKRETISSNFVYGQPQAIFKAEDNLRKKMDAIKKKLRV